MIKFLTLIRSNIYNREFYRTIDTRTLGYTFKYFMALIVLVSLILTVLFSFRIVPEVNTYLKSFPEKALSYYPDELEVVIENGQVRTNVSEPYYIPVPLAFSTDASLPANLFVIDTLQPFQMESFNAYDTAILVTKDSVVYRENSGKITITPLENASLTVNEANVGSWIGVITPYFKYVSVAIVLGLFLGLSAVGSWMFIYALLGALLVFIFARVLTLKFTYGKSYKIALHALTLPFIIQSVLWPLQYSLTDIPLLFSIVFLVIVWVNVFWRRGEVMQPPADSAPTPDMPPVVG